MEQNKYCMSVVLSGVYLTVEVVSLFQGPDVHVVYCYSFKSDLESFSLWNYISHVFQIKIQIETILVWDDGPNQNI